MANGAILDSSITASSYQAHGEFNREPHLARLGTGKYWGSTDSEPWIQVDLGDIHKVTGLQTEGHDGHDEYKYWVKQINVQVGMNEEDLLFIEDDQGQKKVTKKNN